MFLWETLNSAHFSPLPEGHWIVVHALFWKKSSFVNSALDKTSQQRQPVATGSKIGQSCCFADGPHMHQTVIPLNSFIMSQSWERKRAFVGPLHSKWAKGSTDVGCLESHRFFCCHLTIMSHWKVLKLINGTFVRPNRTHEQVWKSHWGNVSLQEYISWQERLSHHRTVHVRSKGQILYELRTIHLNSLFCPAHGLIIVKSRKYFFIMWENFAWQTMFISQKNIKLNETYLNINVFYRQKQIKPHIGGSSQCLS